MHYDLETGFVVVTWADKPLAFALRYPWMCLWFALIALMLIIMIGGSLNRYRRFTKVN